MNNRIEKTNKTYNKLNKTATPKTHIEGKTNVLEGGANIERKIKEYKNTQYFVYVGWR